MSEELNIRIPDPCHESWDGMSPGGKGRFCNACNKTVVDFTRMGDNEILQYFKGVTPNKVCGRFTSRQINQAILAEPEMKIRRSPNHFLWPVYRIAALMITGFTLLMSSCRHTMGEPAMEIKKSDSCVLQSVRKKQDSVQNKTVIKKQKRPFIEKEIDPTVGNIILGETHKNPSLPLHFPPHPYVLPLPKDTNPR